MLDRIVDVVPAPIAHHVGLRNAMQQPGSSRERISAAAAWVIPSTSTTVRPEGKTG